MGVDFYTCQRCRRTFPDCGRYFSCSCEARFCSDRCGERQEVEPEDDENDEVTSCVFCRNEDASTADLLSFCLGELGITEEQATTKLLERRRAEAAK